MKDYFADQGGTEFITGSRDATREAFQKGIPTDGDVWTDMNKSHYLTSHSYEMSSAAEIARNICTDYFPPQKQGRTVSSRLEP